MSLTTLVRSFVIVGIGGLAGRLSAADSAAAAPNRPKVTAARVTAARLHSPAKPAAIPHIAEPDQDQLISEILGISTVTTQRAAAKVTGDKRSVFTCVTAKKQPNESESNTNRRQPTSGAFFGRIIGVNLDTSTVDIEFEGRRATTVGSKFSVFHDYALSTEYLGNLEIVYLAGGNRAIAKPGGRTDITRMGKGDRVSGRVVAKQVAAGGASQSAGNSSASRSCVNPTNDEMPPVPPPDPAPYIPEEPAALAPPAPSPATMTRTSVHKDILSSYRSADLGKRPAPATRFDTADTRAVESSPASASPTVPATKASSVARKGNSAPVPLPLPITADLTTRPAAPPKWLGLSARSWAALLKSNGRSPETASLEAQAAHSPEKSKQSAKNLWCAVKPKPTGVAKAVPEAMRLTAKLPPPSILLFEE